MGRLSGTAVSFTDLLLGARGGPALAAPLRLPGFVLASSCPLGVCCCDEHLSWHTCRPCPQASCWRRATPWRACCRTPRAPRASATWAASQVRLGVLHKRMGVTQWPLPTRFGLRYSSSCTVMAERVLAAEGQPVAAQHARAPSWDVRRPTSCWVQQHGCPCDGVQAAPRRAC